MADHITVGRQNMQQQILPRTAAGHATSAPTYIVHQSQQVSQTSPAKKKTPVGHWDLKASSLYRITNVPGLEDLPEIW